MEASGGLWRCVEEEVSIDWLESVPAGRAALPLAKNSSQRIYFSVDLACLKMCAVNDEEGLFQKHHDHAIMMIY